MTIPGDGTEPEVIGNSLFGWVDGYFYWVRDTFSPSAYEPYARGSDGSPPGVSDLTHDVRLVAVIATGVMMLAALALLIALIALLRTQRNPPPGPAPHAAPWLAPEVQVYAGSGPVAQVGYVPGVPGIHPNDQPLEPTR